MAIKITVYQYELFDAPSGTVMRSRLPATRGAIEAAGGKVLEETAQQVDLDQVDCDGVLTRMPRQQSR